MNLRSLHLTSFTSLTTVDRHLRPALNNPYFSELHMLSHLFLILLYHYVGRSISSLS